MEILAAVHYYAATHPVDDRVMADGTGDLKGDLLQKNKGSQHGKGRKERMRIKIEKLRKENEQQQEKAQELAIKNQKLKRPVLSNTF